ncbi:MAG: UvrD-helicase domain-containing protein [Desulfosarcina sp.]|nr:UvrD-helicase domain-containing protein [Desulfosarcina sp.]MBC2742538.1 UvrD-helicase domain-containing protein [Desulfosarcina sp.]MBC2765448.1 UvrD-helicase domain-containing protein [Desulfosarcina sp.]
MISDSFIADLHIHSKFSRATARNLDIENIYIWAQLKGITVVGTGDFTHPEWFSHILEKLEQAEPGLYRLKPDIACCCDEAVPPSCRAPVRFMLSCEISNIYKKRGLTRKNHNLVFFPDLERVRRFNTRLESIGNISSDGRPILGLDARDLLEIVLETSDEGFLVPAHIWTPWFSMLGSKSGFDSIEECFEDLSPHIFAAETGLSSDPSMNWRVSDLDNITLISNSDAHSPSKLGREANLFKTNMSYHAIRSAMEKGDKNQFKGTFEFYPEEGKYHVDGHRKCEVCFTPAETHAHLGICPVCGKPLTLGVLHRVEDLATRPEGIRPNRAFPFYRLIPLDDLLSEIFRVGAQSKKVNQTHRSLLENLGNEFKILHYLDREKIESAGVPLFAEAIFRMRENRVSFSPGYDGIFGTAHIFTDWERDRLLGQRSLFSVFEKTVELAGADKRSTNRKFSDKSACSAIPEPAVPVEATIRLNNAQQKAVDHPKGSLMIVAGPGTGKTRTLTHKIARLIETGVDVDRLLAVTFTNKAAREMKERLAALLGNEQSLPFVGTFHALGYRILSQSKPDKILSVVDEETRKVLVRDVMALNGLSKKGCGVSVEDLMGWIVSAKQKMLSSKDPLDGVCPPDQLARFGPCYKTYQHLLRVQQLVDFEDLIFRAVQLQENDPDIRARYTSRFSDIFIDEYQDINAGQYRLVRLLAGDHANTCIIGDPDQSIYGFRGSDVVYFKRFMQDFPGSQTIFLRRNYRSTQAILEISAQVIQKNPELMETAQRRAVYSDMTGDRTIHVMELATENAEAVAIGKTIEKMVGGTGFFSLDSGAVDGTIDQEPLSFADFAVLLRTRSQGDAILRILEKAGIPCQVIDRKTVLDHPGVKSVLSVFKLLHGMGVFTDLQASVGVFNSSVSIKTLEILKYWAYEKNLPLAETLVKSRRLPIPQMGRARQQRLYDFIGKLSSFKKRNNGLSVTDTLESILKKADFREKYKGDHTFESGYTQILETGNAYQTDAAGFLAAIALSRDTDTYDHRVEKVALSTIHAAKGLEFPVVFIAGCEDELIPYRSTTRPVDVEEERRLFYVAMTRAKRHLFLTKAGTRQVNGQIRPRRWSPFVKDIEDRYKRFSGQSGKKPEKPAQEQLSLF